MIGQRKLNILSVSSEVAPFSKTGGLGDVSRDLPKALQALGHHVSIVTPYYTFIDQQRLPLDNLGTETIKIGAKKFQVTFLKSYLSPEIPVYFVRYDPFYGQSKIYGYPNDNLRFYLFDEAVIRLAKKLTPRTDLIHCHDWQSGLIPNLLKTAYRRDPVLGKIGTLFTIHNLPFQFGTDWWVIPKNKIDAGRGRPPIQPAKIPFINFTRRAILNADIINTVSERYAAEILTPEFGQSLEKLLRRRQHDFYGIVNGIDYAVYNPSFDSNLYYNYDWNSLDRKRMNKTALQEELGLTVNADRPLIGLVSRLSEQKGFYLILDILPDLMRQSLQIVVVGSGHQDFIREFRKYAKKYPRQIAIYSPFTEKMASRVYAGSDMFLMPSRYEPCGISQMISLRYGSIPIVHETGGLHDTITNYNPRTGKGNGFVLTRYDRVDLFAAIARAIENYHHTKAWEQLTWQAMRVSYSWEVPAKKYVSLYRLATRKAKNK